MLVSKKRLECFSGRKLVTLIEVVQRKREREEGRKKINASWRGEKRENERSFLLLLLISRLVPIQSPIREGLSFRGHRGLKEGWVIVIGHVVAVN